MDLLLPKAYLFLNFALTIRFANVNKYRIPFFYIGETPLTVPELLCSLQIEIHHSWVTKSEPIGLEVKINKVRLKYIYYK